jgi:hypothetical protein
MNTSAPTFRRFVCDLQFFREYVQGTRNLYTKHFQSCPAALMRPGTYVAVCEPFIMDPASGAIEYKWDHREADDRAWISGSSMGVKYARYFLYVVDLNHKFMDGQHIITWKLKSCKREEIPELNLFGE